MLDRDHERSMVAWLARRLGWVSLVLGLTQLAAPDQVNRLIGIEPSPRRRVLMRLVGAQELATGVGLVTRTGTRTLLWARAGSDLVHLGMLGTAAANPRNHRARLSVTAVAVAASAVVDAFASLRADADVLRRELRVTVATTVRREPLEVYRYWRDLQNLPTFMTHLRSVTPVGEARSRWVADAPGPDQVTWEAEIVQDAPGELLAWRSTPDSDLRNAGVVRFAPAPGQRGTEVTVELEFTPPAGALGAAIAKVLGEHPEQQVRDDLRRFKQVMETGELVRTAGSPGGMRSQQFVVQRPAQPVG
jgi:uncharacterized membrane protein